MSPFRPIDRKTPSLLRPSMEDWLPEGHLARFIVEVVEGLDVNRLESAYRGRGSAAYHPALLLSVLGQKAELFKFIRHYCYQAETNPTVKPFAHPYYWAAFTVNGM